MRNSNEVSLNQLVSEFKIDHRRLLLLEDQEAVNNSGGIELTDKKLRLMKRFLQDLEDLPQTDDDETDNDDKKAKPRSCIITKPSL